MPPVGSCAVLPRDKKTGDPALFSVLIFILLYRSRFYVITEIRGKVIRGVGGLYAVRTVEAGEVSVYTCRAKGILHRGEEKLLIGDEVTLEHDTEVAGGLVISEIAPRRNARSRPPLGDRDCVFAVFFASRPQRLL